MIRLIVTEGDESRVVECSEAAVGIGRGAENPVRITDEGASRNHCRIQRQTDGSFVLYDLASRNGTKLNGQTIERATVKEGDTITVGNATIKVDTLSPDHPAVGVPSEEEETEAGRESALLLVFLSGPARGQSHLVTGKITSIGRRSRDNDIAVFDPGISNRHAEIRRTPDGFMLVDVGSRNGTFLNGERVTRASLKVGDKIALGTTVIEVREPTAGVEAAAAAPPQAQAQPAEEPATDEAMAPESPAWRGLAPYLAAGALALVALTVLASFVLSRRHKSEPPTTPTTSLSQKPSTPTTAHKPATKASARPDPVRGVVAEAKRLAERGLYGPAIERLEAAAERYASQQAHDLAEELRAKARAVLDEKLALLKRAELTGAPNDYQAAVEALEALTEPLRGSGLEGRLNEAIAAAKKAREEAPARAAEAQASRLLARARECQVRKEFHLAALHCREVMARYPGTVAAQEAKKILASLEEKP